MFVAVAAAFIVAGIIWIFAHGHNQNASVPAPEPAPVSVVPVPPPAPPEPALPAVKLSSDTGTGKVAFDDQPTAELQDAQWALDKASAGDHTLKFEGPRSQASFTFSAAPGALPQVKGPIAAKGLLAVVVASTSDHLHVYTSDSAARLSLDGQAPLDITQDGLDLPSVAAGAHELTLSQGNDQYKLDIEVAATPALTTFLESGQNVGTLLVVTGQDKTKVFLNGKAVAETSRGGQLRIPNLEPKDYVVRVFKNGFLELPDQSIRIRKGEQSRISFNLQPVPHLASLSIQGAAPGTTVLLDQAAIGTVQPDGTLNVSTINPGDHVVELRKDRFKPRQFKKHFVAGASVSLAAADASLEAAPAEWKINFSPSDAQVTLTKPGESPIKVASGGALNLSAGSYTLSARTADGFTRTSSLEVTAGQARTLELPLAPSGMAKWDDAAGWKQDKGSYVHKGGDFVLYGASPTSGTFVFSAMLAKGRRLQWVVNYTDANNYVLFQMDDNNFYRSAVRNGEKTDEIKIPNKSEKKSFRTIQIRVEPNQIVHQIKQGDSWLSLDRWAQPGSNLTQGKFGFYIPGGDQVVLSSFGHYSDLNIR